MKRSISQFMQITINHVVFPSCKSRKTQTTLPRSSQACFRAPHISTYGGTNNRCIPYRFEKNGEDQNHNVENRVLVLMISTPKRDDLVFPKGGWEDDETVREAACREALEEAGVRGILSENPLGIWEFRSKSRENSCSLKGGCRGYMFALKVTEELDTWPEQSAYGRKWLTIEDAFKFCRYDWMREALTEFLTVVTKEKALELPNIQADTGTEHQIIQPSCFEKPSGVPCLEGPSTKCVVQG